MAEVLDQEKEQSGAEKASAFSEAAPVPKKKKKNKKKLVRRVVALVVAAGLLGGGIYFWKHRSPSDNGEEVLTEMVSRGSITTVVEGSGAAVAKNSASVTLLSAGQVRDIFVAEGDYVTKGTQLFSVDSKEAQDAFDNARERVRKAEQYLADQQRALNKELEKDMAGDVKAEYAGILTKVEEGYAVGDDVTEKTSVFATLADNTVMLLKLYFSYAYENEIAVGQSASVSIPVTMTQLGGRVHEIHKVDYITPEGGRMFEVVIAVDNPGTLTKDMEATATVAGTNGTVYPYRSGVLDYLRTTELKAPVSGKLTWYQAYQWQKLAAGESIAHIEKDAEDREDDLQRLNDNVHDAEQSLDEARKTLEKEQKNIDSLSSTAPIDGTVLSIGITVGEEAAAGTVAMNIADVTTMKIETQVDEMYVSFVKPGMPVDLQLGETAMIGTVETVSLSAKSENGVARFPMTILVDNSDELLRSGAYIDYSFTASQSDDCLLVPIQCVKSAQTMDGENCKILFVQSDEPIESAVELDTGMMSIPDGFQPVYVEVGISDNRNSEIVSGVEEGMIVYAGIMNNDNMGMMF